MSRSPDGQARGGSQGGEFGLPRAGAVPVTDNLSTYDSASPRAWLADHSRISQVFIPKGACWLNLQEGWWRLFRREALAGVSFANPTEITLATKVARPASSTPAPARGSGAARHRRHATDAAS